MPHSGRKRSIALGCLLGLCLVGCRAVPVAEVRSQRSEVRGQRPDLKSEISNFKSHASNPKSEVRPVSFDEPEIPDDLSFGSELSLDDYLDQVRRRNPSIQAAVAAASAAAEKYPQVVALEDPMLETALAPESLERSFVLPSFMAGVSQKVPWHGKRAWRGDAALALAEAASFDSLEAELRVVESAQLAYFDYYLVYRELALNRANVEALQKLRDSAKAMYEATKVTQQDVLQADVELADIQRQRIELAQRLRTAVARLNALLQRVPSAPLPPPPRSLARGFELPPAERLREEALTARPELSARAARIDAERAAVALAYKEFYPDFEVLGRYDQFWFDHEQRAIIGVNMNLPLNKARRWAAVREALFRVSQMQAEYEQQIATIGQDVESAHARAEAGGQTVRLFAEKIIPAAEDNASAALAGYEANKVDFLRLVEAQRQLIELRENEQKALTQYHRDLAELERAVGGDF